MLFFSEGVYFPNIGEKIATYIYVTIPDKLVKIELREYLRSVRNKPLTAGKVKSSMKL